MNEAATQTLPTVPKIIQLRPWDDDEELVSLKLQRNELDLKTQKKKFRKVCRQIRQRVKILKNNIFAEKAASINLVRSARDLEKFYSLSKSHEILGTRARQIAACPPTELRRHFKSHFNHVFNPVPNVTFQTGETLYTPQIPDLPPGPPSIDEIESCIRKLSASKASTDVKIPILKAAISNPNARSCLEKMVSEFWNDGVVQTAWCSSAITALYKHRGSRKDPENYRGISVQSCIIKTLMASIFSRLSDWYNVQILDQQYGFAKEKSCSDAIQILKSVQSYSYAQQEEVFCGFIDLRAAFDWVHRPTLWSSIQARINKVTHPNLLNTFTKIELLYNHSGSYIKEEGEDQRFGISTGVLQGSVEGPRLFCLLFDVVVREFQAKCDEEGLGLVLEYAIPNEVTTRSMNRCCPAHGKTKCLWCCFADDMIIFFESLFGLQRGMEILHNILCKFGLQMNKIKSETMIMNFLGEESTYPETIIKVQGNPIKNTKIFKYLGTIIDFRQAEATTQEIQHRKNSFHGAFRANDAFLKNNLVHKSIRREFFDSLCRSRLTYSCVTWTTTKAQLTSLAGTYAEGLRKMLRGGYAKKGSDEEISWAFQLSNAKILQKFHAVPLDIFVQRQRLKFFAHTCRLPNTSMVKQLTFLRPKRRKRRPSTLYSVVMRDKTTIISEAQLLRECFNRKY